MKAQLKKANVTYEILAKMMKEHGFHETKASISNKLARATVPASFFLACLAALGKDGIRLEDLQIAGFYSNIIAAMSQPKARQSGGRAKPQPSR